MLADASYALYQTERHPSATIDWQATLVAGHHAVRGAEALLRGCPTGCLLACLAPLTTAAEDVARCYAQVGAGLLGRDGRATAPLPERPALDWPTDLGRELYALADLRVWLDGLREDLGRLTGETESPDLRQRVTHLTEG